ncbi:response regulator transcription factor [Myxococcota bacterium]|nr:response regulator transcription factor [Myxococcota bacterium]
MLATSILVLAIEDDPLVRRHLRGVLGAHGHRLVEAESGAEGIALAAQYQPDVVLLDVGLPDLSGIEVARRLRPTTRAPIIVLSSLGDERHKVAGLDAGADDYLTKPVGAEELMARIRAQLRRSVSREVGPDATFVSGALRVDLAKRSVVVAGRPVHLTPTEFKLLALLIDRAGSVVGHREILEHVWGPSAAERTTYLRVYMTHLRKKIEVEPGCPRLVLNEPGVGYRLLRLPDVMV